MSQVYNKVVIDIHTGAVLERVGEPYRGPCVWLKGPSAEQRDLASSKAGFYRTLQNSYQTTFAGQTHILKALDAAFQPILQAGPNQYGFSTGETAALKSGAINQTASTFAANQKALNNQLAARGGGNTFLPSGAEAQLQAENYNAAAANESNALLGIQQAGYEQGRQNFNTAANVLGNTASIYNPSGAAGAANTGGSSAETSFSDIAQEEQAASPWATVGGIVGGAASSFLSGGMSSMMKKGGG